MNEFWIHLLLSIKTVKPLFLCYMRGGTQNCSISLSGIKHYRPPPQSNWIQTYKWCCMHINFWQALFYFTLGLTSKGIRSHLLWTFSCWWDSVSWIWVWNIHRNYDFRIDFQKKKSIIINVSFYKKIILLTFQFLLRIL